MKLLALLCSSLLLPLPAHAFQEGMPPKREVWEKLLNSRFVVTERERLIQLATFFPQLYGFHFICQFQPAGKGAAPLAVLPGEWIESGEGGTLRCPDRYELTLERQTRLRLMQARGLPRFVIEQGKVTMAAKQDAFFLETPAYRLGVVGEGKEQTLDIEVREESSSLFCDRGSFAMTIETRRASGKQKLASRDCRLGISIEGGPVRRFVNAFDQIEVDDLTLPRAFWPPSLQSQKPGEALIGLQLALVPPADQSGALRASWIFQRTLPTASPELNCIVFGQKHEADLPVELKKLTTSTRLGSIEIDPAYRGGFVSMVCETDSATLSSNLVDLSPNGTPQK